MNLQSFINKIKAAVSNGMKLGNVVLNAGVLKYPNRATEMYARHHDTGDKCS